MKALPLALAAAFASPFAAACAKEGKPNIVFIMADDLGWADVGFHSGNAPTPHLDQLAAKSLELTQHYVAPVCSPTRTGLMTGRCWSRFGVTIRKTNALAVGYAHAPQGPAGSGLRHLPGGQMASWFQARLGPQSFWLRPLATGRWPVASDRGITSTRRDPFSTTWHRNEQLLEEKGHVTDLIAREAVRWISERKDRPFFLYVPFTAVHLPIKEPDEWLMKVPANIEGDVARHYAACIMHLDDAVGRIVSALEKSGQRENTLLVFTSDNGGSTAENGDQKYPADDYPKGKLTGNNAPLRGQKGDIYEGGIRVPTIVSWPGKLKTGKSTPQPKLPTGCQPSGLRSTS